MAISVIIPVFNRKEFTRQCLRSLRRQTMRAAHIIVINDGSTDGTSTMLKSEFPEVITLDGNGRLFWTAAINKGIRLALLLNADYIITMNNDTVASDDFIENMLKAAVLNPKALLGALDIDACSKRPYYGGELFYWRNSNSRYLLDLLKPEEQQGLHEVSLYPGRGLLIPKVVFKKIGLFNEQGLPHYLADYDFTQMARRNGFRIFCNYEAKLFTYPGESGNHKIRARKSAMNYLRHLFSIRGGGNLKDYTVYTLRNCPPRDILHALVFGYLRRLGGYWLK